MRTAIESSVIRSTGSPGFSVTRRDRSRSLSSVSSAPSVSVPITVAGPSFTSMKIATSPLLSGLMRGTACAARHPRFQ